MEELFDDVGKFIRVYFKHSMDREGITIDNTVAVSNKPVLCSGWWLGTIQDARKNSRVHVDLDYSIDALDVHSKIWEYFRLTGLLASRSTDDISFSTNAIEELERKYKKREKESEKEFSMRLLLNLLNGTVKESEVLKILNS